MFRLLIVDDEPSTRKGILNCVDWREYNIDTIDEASNGQEAIEKALYFKPDIVIADVRMPVMDGLEFSKRLKEIRPQCKIIILSAYDEFSYAKKALTIGVSDYLLKPVCPQELVETIIRLQKNIIDEQKRNEKQMNADKIINENINLIKSNFIKGIITGEYSKNTICEKAKLLNIEFTGLFYQAVIIDIDNFMLITDGLKENEVERLKLSVLNAAEKIVLKNAIGIVGFSEFDYLIAILNSNYNYVEWITNIAKQIQDAVKRELKLSVTIGIGEAFQDISMLSTSYNQALLAMRNKVFVGKGKIIHICQCKNTINSPHTLFYPTEEEKNLMHSVKLMDIDSINRIIEKLFNEFAELFLNYDDIKNICIRLITLAVWALQDICIDINKYFNNCFDPEKEIEKYETIDELKSWLKEFFQKIVNIIMTSKSEKYKSIIKKAMKYVEEHYKEDISLSDIASVVYITPNYFSRIFKEETGYNFVDWLNKYRIEKAKSFLSNPQYKVYEIAERVGYSDYKYFTYNFKKYTGYTPREYKNIYGKDYNTG